MDEIENFGDKIDEASTPATFARTQQLLSCLSHLATSKNRVAIELEGVLDHEQYQCANDFLDYAIIEHCRRCCILIEQRVFGSDLSQIGLINLEEVDYLHNDGLKIAELAMIIPRIGFSCLAPIGMILEKIVEGVINYARENRLVLEQEREKCTTSAKQLLLDILRFRGLKHEPCCRTFVDAISQQIAFVSFVPDDVFWVVKLLCDENFFFIRAADSLFALSSAEIGENNDLARLMLANTTNFCPQLSSLCFFSFVNNPGVFDSLRTLDVSISNLKDDHPFHVLTTIDELDKRMVLFTHSALTLNFYVDHLRMGERVFFDSSFDGLRPFASEYGAGHQRKRIESKLSQLCDEIMSVIGLLDENDASSEQLDYICLSIFDLTEWIMTKTLYWSDEFISLVKRSAHLWIFWLQKHAKFFDEEFMLSWSMTWAVRATKAVLLILNCPLIPVEIFTKEQIASFRFVRDTYLSKPAPTLFSDEHSQIVANLSQILRLKSDDKVHNFDSDRYHFICLLGTGRSGKVFKCFDILTGNFVAIKSIECSDMEKLENAKNEIKYMSKLKHMNLVRYIDYYCMGKCWNLVMEFCEGTNLGMLKGVFKETNELWIRKIGRQILVGLAYLHAHNIVHRDIKPGNILFTGSGQIKLGDLGEARLCTEIAQRPLVQNGPTGTVVYMAPECFRNQPITAKADIWSFGCVLWFLCSGEVPWSQVQDPISVISRLTNSGVNPFASFRLQCSDSLGTVISNCLEPNPDLRPTAAELLALDLFAGVPDVLI